MGPRLGRFRFDCGHRVFGALRLVLGDDRRGTLPFDAFGAGKALENEPACPAGGTYAWAGAIPAMSTPYGNCDLIDADGVTTHVLAAADTRDW